jgi:hypothetical protein
VSKLGTYLTKETLRQNTGDIFREVTTPLTPPPHEKYKNEERKKKKFNCTYSHKGVLIFLEFS